MRFFSSLEFGFRTLRAFSRMLGHGVTCIALLRVTVPILTSVSIRFYISVLMLSASHVQETCLCRSFRRELSAVLLQPSSMADLPRWVDRSDVDSKAMLGAFLKYHSEIRQTLHHPELVFQPTWEGHLFAYMHRDPPRLPFPDAVKLPMPLRIPELPCTQRACSRCGVRGGGWVFRWYSPYWAKCYNGTRRPGAWKAPEPPLADPSYHDEYWEQHLRFWFPLPRSS